MTAPVITAQDLGHAYGDVVALHHMDLDVLPGSVGLVGANGAGKTTFIKILLGILEPTVGSVSVLGVDPAVDLVTVRNRVGYMPEGDCLPLEQSAADFVSYTAELAGIPGSEARQRASDILTMVGLHEERFRYLGDFSTGMKQRAMLAQLRSTRKTLRPLSPRLARDMLPGGRGATLALAGLLPPGWFPTAFLAGFPGMRQFDGWLDGLWIPAVRASDGDLVVFGRDRTDVPVAVAVEASSAVPGMFRPRLIDEVAYIDGGVTSSTHADLLIDTGVDRVFISAPMSKPSRRLFASNARKRRSAEVAALREAGIETIVVEPSREAVQAAKGFPRRKPQAANDIVRHAAEATRLALATA